MKTVIKLSPRNTLIIKLSLVKETGILSPAWLQTIENEIPKPSKVSAIYKVLVYTDKAKCRRISYLIMEHRSKQKSPFVVHFALPCLRQLQNLVENIEILER